MSQTDKRLRVNHIPFRGTWFSNGALGVGVQLIDGVADGDLKTFAEGNAAQVRIARPAKGDLVEARLTINAVSPPTGFSELSIYVGDFDTDGLTPLTLTSAEIARRWKILSGFSAPLSVGVQDTYYIDGLNLMPLIPKRGEAGFNEDAFIIGLNLVNRDAGFVLFDFFVDCSVQIAEVRK